MIGTFVMKEFTQLRLIKITFFFNIFKMGDYVPLKLSTFIIINVKNMKKSINKQKQPLEVFCKKKCSWKFKTNRKTPVPESGRSYPANIRLDEDVLKTS